MTFAEDKVLIFMHVLGNWLMTEQNLLPTTLHNYKDMLQCHCAEEQCHTYAVVAFIARTE